MKIPAEYKSLSYALIGIVLIGFLSLPASAGTVLDIQVTESMNLEDEFDGVTLTQGASTGEGEIIITNTLGSTYLYDISLNFSTGSTSGWGVNDPSNVTLTNGDGYATVHINLLGAGESTTLSYDCSGSRPVIFQESYESEKLLVGGATDVSLTLVNNASGSTITNIQLVKTASDSNGNSTADFRFSNEDADVGTAAIVGGTEINWTISELNATVSQATLNFTATENDEGAHSSGGIQSSMKYYMGNATLQFTIDDGTVSASGIRLNEDPTATTANFEITLQKEQLSSGDGNDWAFTPRIENTDDETISFSISSVTVYVTNSTVLEKDSAFSTHEYGSGEIAKEGIWSAYDFVVEDFPDPVPVGWIDVDLSVDLSDSGNQLEESYSTAGGTYKLVETIYIINGYLVEAKKSITKNATNEDQYDITLWVHNLGNLETPPVVVVYDIVPTDFSMVYNETDPDGSTAVSSPIEGYAYWWDVGPLAPADMPGNQTYINYTVQGTGTYSLTDLFILGIDPSYSLNMQSTPVLKTGARVVSGSGIKAAINMLMMACLLLGMVGLKKKRKDR
ncbi:hypothetical protein FTO70_04960 [Methanosarcina sp. KYL-1]|uniref:hypothetical protein n=1 Tax=Methanosarcina sp. KYL-1 TaxID=2602068 RepID=UPI0021006D6E|nr:hypothetical protein [Methanosarcina sp. KYL-1]MCQ1535046.1 hypothetical protein [Methanosarcina sp. KYL-1]